MLRNIYVRFSLMVIFLAGAAYLLLGVWEVGDCYPFERMMLDGKLHYSTRILKEPASTFRTSINEINGISVDQAGLYHFLKTEQSREFVVSGTNANSESIQLYVRCGRNLRLLAVFMFLLLFALIYAVWGFFAAAVGTFYRKTELFARLSIIIGFLFLTQALALFDQRFIPLQLFLGILTGMTVSIVGLAIVHAERIKKLSMILYTLTPVLTLATWLLFRHDVRSQLAMCFGSVVAGTILYLAIIIYKVCWQPSVTLWSKVLSIMGGVIGLLIPFAANLVYLYVDIKLPLNVINASSVFIPLFMGHVIVGENIKKLSSFRRRNAGRIVINMLAAFSVGILFLLIADHELDYLSRTLLNIAFLVAGMLALELRRRIVARKDRFISGYNDRYVDSLQKLTAIAIDDRPLSEKVSCILREAATTIGATEVRYYLFDPISDDRKRCEIEQVHESSQIYQYYLDNRSIIWRDSIFSGYDFVDVRNDSQFSGTNLIIPLERDEEVIALISAGAKIERASYSELDLLFLRTVSIIINQAISNHGLHCEYIEQGRLEKELDEASFRQLQLFPKRVPFQKGLSLAFYSRPFIKVTGDYFNFIELDRDRTAIVIGDVAGHGLPAAMVLSVIALMITALFREKAGLKDIFSELNKYLSEYYRGKELMTLFIGVYDNQSKTMSYINAGHCPPIIRRAQSGQCEVLDTKSSILGVFSSVCYLEHSVTFSKDDEMLLFTDGVLDVCLRDGRLVNEELLTEILKDGSANVTAEDKFEKIVQEIERAGADNIHDDITLIAAGFTG